MTAPMDAQPVMMSIASGDGLMSEPPPDASFDAVLADAQGGFAGQRSSSGANAGVPVSREAGDQPVKMSVLPRNQSVLSDQPVPAVATADDHDFGWSDVFNTENAFYGILGGVRQAPTMESVAEQRHNSSKLTDDDLQSVARDESRRTGRPAGNFTEAELRDAARAQSRRAGYASIAEGAARRFVYKSLSGVQVFADPTVDMLAKSIAGTTGVVFTVSKAHNGMVHLLAQRQGWSDIQLNKYLASPSQQVGRALMGPAIASGEALIRVGEREETGWLYPPQKDEEGERVYRHGGEWLSANGTRAFNQGIWGGALTALPASYAAGAATLRKEATAKAAADAARMNPPAFDIPERPPSSPSHPVPELPSGRGAAPAEQPGGLRGWWQEFKADLARARQVATSGKPGIFGRMSAAIKRGIIDNPSGFFRTVRRGVTATSGTYLVTKAVFDVKGATDVGQKGVTNNSIALGLDVVQIVDTNIEVLWSTAEHGVRAAGALLHPIAAGVTPEAVLVDAEAYQRDQEAAVDRFRAIPDELGEVWQDYRNDMLTKYSKMTEDLTVRLPDHTEGLGEGIKKAIKEMVAQDEFLLQMQQMRSATRFGQLWRR